MENHNSNSILKPKIELHVHLDGSVRLSTIIRTAIKRNLSLPTTDYNNLKKIIECHTGNLTKFLQSFEIFLPILKGCEDTLQLIATEFVEDAHKCGLFYTEVRYCPYALAAGEKNYEDAEHVVSLIQKGLKIGEEKYGVKVRSILIMMRHKPERAIEVVKLAKAFMQNGVVGIDIAGDENLTNKSGLGDQFTEVFQLAKTYGLHRTVHAGENGPWENVQFAIDNLCAERIGHGYATVNNEKIIEICKDRKIHFEMCPCSSIITGSVSEDWSKHPIKQIIKNGLSYSINSDDTLLTGGDVSQDYEICLKKIGLTHEDLILANFNAAESSFLPTDEKSQLIMKLVNYYQENTPKQYQNN